MTAVHTRRLRATVVRWARIATVAGLAAGALVVAVPDPLSSAELTAEVRRQAVEAESPEPDQQLASLPPNARALIVGDSFAEAYGASSPDAGWANIAIESLGWRGTVDAVGGTGFTKSTATDGRRGVAFHERLLDHAEEDARFDVIVLQGGLNDWRASPAAESSAVAFAVRTAQVAWPEAVVVVFGPTKPIAERGSRQLVHLPVIREAAEDAGAVFIDPMSPTPWITRQNTDLFDSGDGLHLNDRGYAYLAARFVATVLAFQHTE